MAESLAVDPEVCDVEIEEQEEEPCTVGVNSGTDCNLKIYARTCGLIKIKDLTVEEQGLVIIRSEIPGLGEMEEAHICLHHKALLLSKYEILQKKCCDPFMHHPEQQRKKSLRSITQTNFEFLKTIQSKCPKPGQKICRQCRNHLCDLEKANSPKLSTSSGSEAGESLDVLQESVDTSLTALGESPLKLKRLARRDIPGYVKQKVMRTSEAVKHQVSTIAGLDPEALEAGPSQQKCEKCDDYSLLIDELKEKMRTSDKSQKIQILTLEPKSWTIKETAEEFGVSQRMVKTARQLKKDSGILAFPSKRKGKVLSEETKSKVLRFYEDDEFTRLCPGKKDCVSVRIEGKKVQKQKRLLLSNLKELFTVYKAKHGSDIGFSKFCELRPRWCVTVGAPGMHSVCVCTIHQNVKLMIAGINIEDDYKALMSNCVCDLESKNCMLQRCKNCPGEEKLREYLTNCLEEFEPDDIIEFKQWEHTDREKLSTMQLTVEEFIEELASKIMLLTAHHFIAKHQSGYLKTLKEHLEVGDVIILMDFSENYSFVVQDATQGFHWENSQATLHPFTVYYRKDDQLKTESFCVVSNCLKHDTVAVHVFVKKLINILENDLSNLNKIHYFSDGAAGQYKNFKNFLNLCYHQNDFNGVIAEWNFFATSHGKSPCDGIGGTVKRLAAHASLQRPTNNQILTPVQLFKFCNENVHGIKFFFVSTEDIDEARNEQEERFKLGHTVAGTQENHHFVPINKEKVEVRRVSRDEMPFVATVATRNELDDRELNLQPGQYVACVYDNVWWIGNVCETSDEEKDALINFMWPHGPASQFHWPEKSDRCWIPEQHVLRVIAAPSLSGATGRMYTVPRSTSADIDKEFKNFESIFALQTS